MTPETRVPAYPTSPVHPEPVEGPPFPRWERVGACPVLDTGVRVTPGHPERTAPVHPERTAPVHPERTAVHPEPTPPGGFPLSRERRGVRARTPVHPEPTAPGGFPLSRERRGVRARTAVHPERTAPVHPELVEGSSSTRQNAARSCHCEEFSDVAIWSTSHFSSQLIHNPFTAVHKPRTTFANPPILTH